MLRSARIGLLALVLHHGLLAAQRPASPARWTVEETPSVLIGQADGEAAHLFTNVRAATVLSDERVVVLDAGRGFAELRYYSPTGEFLTAAGAWGEGPFEFQYPVGLHRLNGDSILVISQDQRFSVFGPHGEQGTSGRLPLATPLVRPTFLLSRSRLVVDPPRASGLPGTGLRVDSSRYVALDLDSGTATTIAVVPGFPMYFERRGNGVLNYVVPFPPMALSASSGGVLWVMRSDEPIVRGYDAEGRLLTAIDLPLEAERVGLLDRRRFRAGLEEMAERIPQYARYADDVSFPELFPLAGNLKADPRGNVWVQEYELPWATGDQTWHVFDPVGRRVAVVRMPEAAASRCGELSQHPAGCDRVLQLGEGFILMLRKDDLGVLRVAKHRVTPDRR